MLGLLLFLGAIQTSERYARPLVWIGTISYSLYLLHPLAFYPIALVSSHVPALASLPLSIHIALAMLLAVALASATYIGIEKPSIACGRWLSRMSFDRVRATWAKAQRG